MAAEAGKGSRPRPFSVTQVEYDQRWDAIFAKDLKDEPVTPSVEQMKQGTCGCGRSPTGECIGWHNLTEQGFRDELAKYRERQSTSKSDHDQAAS